MLISSQRISGDVFPGILNLIFRRLAVSIYSLILRVLLEILIDILHKPMRHSTIKMNENYVTTKKLYAAATTC